MPVEQMERLERSIPGEVRNLHHRGGDATEVVFTAELEAAVLDTRFVWVKDGQALPDYEDGARGKLQALALVRDVEGQPAGPVILTFKGLSSREFSEALKAHRETVRQASGGKAPAWAFFGRYTAGETEMRGSGRKSLVTSVLYDGNGFDPDAAYVGDGATSSIEALWRDIDAWKAAWDQNGGNDGNRVPSEGPQIKDPDAPATEAQWRLVRKLMGELGLDDERHQDEALAEKGFDPEALTKGQASELIERLKVARDNGA